MYAILNYNPQLRPYTAELTQRVTHFQAVKAALAPGGSLSQMANGHFYFGIHHHPEGWVYREWAPAAQQASSTAGTWPSRKSAAPRLMPSSCWKRMAGP